MSCHIDLIDPDDPTAPVPVAQYSADVIAVWRGVLGAAFERLHELAGEQAAPILSQAAVELLRYPPPVNLAEPWADTHAEATQALVGLWGWCRVNPTWQLSLSY